MVDRLGDKSCGWGKGDGEQGIDGWMWVGVGEKVMNEG